MFDNANSLSGENQCAIQTSFSTNPNWSYEWECTLGCPYSFYMEYNPNYSAPDALLCITLIVEGCTNDAAENFNPEANLDDETCELLGCTIEAAENYHPEATLQDDSCILFGCTNDNADNFSDQATDDDGSCIIYGCTLSAFPNYNPDATVDDLSCSLEVIIVLGCTDYLTCNYNPEANTDDGSCIFQEQGYDCDGNLLITQENINQAVDAWLQDSVSTELIYGHISDWDVSNVNNMNLLFSGSNFNGDLSSWDVSNVTNMASMFAWATSFNSDLSSWDVSNVTDMSFMFDNAASLSEENQCAIQTSFSINPNWTYIWCE
jgi:surface protein